MSHHNAASRLCVLLYGTNVKILAKRQQAQLKTWRNEKIPHKELKGSYGILIFRSQF